MLKPFILCMPGISLLATYTRKIPLQSNLRLSAFFNSTVLVASGSVLAMIKPTTFRLPALSFNRKTKAPPPMTHLSTWANSSEVWRWKESRDYRPAAQCNETNITPCSITSYGSTNLTQQLSSTIKRSNGRREERESCKRERVISRKNVLMKSKCESGLFLAQKLCPPVSTCVSWITTRRSETSLLSAGYHCYHPSSWASRDL